MKTNSQLIKKAKETGNYQNIYPIAYIDGIIDKESNEKLSDILIRYNHILVPWQGSVKATRDRVTLLMRRQGLWITYVDDNSEITTEVYKGSAQDIISNWADDVNWEIVPDVEYVQNNASKIPDGAILPQHLSKELQELLLSSGKIVNLPDGEDLTTQGIALKFKDREYNPEIASGKGYKILRKNWNIVNSNNINLLTQDMINDSNTIYEIRYDFNLNGQTITIPEGCVLKFDGGSLSNGTVACVNTIIESKTRCFINIVLSDIECVSADWFYDGKAATIIELINQGFTIKFSDKTYIFETSISTNKRFNIKGAGKNSTILVFPNSSGIERILPYNGAWDRNNSIEDLTIDSRDTCISLGNSILNTSNMLSVSTFKNLNLKTQTGYCIYNKLDGTANSQPYHNLFENIELHHGNSCKPYIYGIIGLNNIFRNIYDIDTAEKKAISMFQNCSGNFEDLNISYGMSIDNFLLIGPSESTIITADNTASLYKSNDKGDIGTIISLSNCNFEAFQGGFIKVTAANIYPNVEFNGNVQFNYINSAVSTNDYLIECFGLKRWKGTFNFYGTSSSYIMTYSPVKINSTEELAVYQENIIRPLRVEGIDYLKIARFVNSIQEGTDIVYENSIPSQHISNNTETLYTSNVFVFKRNNERYYVSNRSKPIYSDYLLNNAIYTTYTDVDTSIFYSVFIPDSIRVTVDSDITISNIGIVNDNNNEISYRKKLGTLLRIYIDPSSTGSITLKFNDVSYSQSYIILTEEQQSSLILEAGRTYYFELIVTNYGVYAWKMIKYKTKYPDNATYGTSLPFVEKGASPQRFFNIDTGNNYYSAETKEAVYWRNEDGTLTSKVVII